jgi:hypothetical protein
VNITTWRISYAYNVGGSKWVPMIMVRDTYRSAVMEAANLRSNAKTECVSISGPYDHEIPEKVITP